MTFRTLFFAFLVLCPALAWADDSCPSADARACIAARILKDSGNIEEKQWRDQTLRDLAASLTYDGQVDEAIALIGQISNPDTQAMTVRAIGMAAALYGKRSDEDLRAVFTKLNAAATKIQQPDANAIAQTYIAMAQAFAKLDDDAWATANAMTNAALKHKAFGETAEIQAERGDVAKAMKSISQIDTASFRNKSYQKVSEILIKKHMYDDALKSAESIDNPAKRAQALLEILKAQEAETRGTRNDMQDEGVTTATDLPEKIIP